MVEKLPLLLHSESRGFRFLDLVIRFELLETVLITKGVCIFIAIVKQNDSASLFKEALEVLVLGRYEILLISDLDKGASLAVWTNKGVVSAG